MHPKKYKIVPWFIILNYVFLPFWFLFAGIFLILPFEILQMEDAFSIEIFYVFIFGILGAIFLVGCGIYSIRIIPRFRESIIVDDAGITQEHFDSSTTRIVWSENFSIVNRGALGRVELISHDGQRVIMLEHQLGKFRELINLINQKKMESLNLRKEF